MSDYSQSVIFPTVSAKDSDQLSHTLLHYLQARGVISDEATDCVLGAPLGFQPGPMYRLASVQADDRLLELRTNGAHFVTRRTVFDTGGMGLELECPACGQSMEPATDWSNAVAEWHAGSGKGALACLRCGAVRPVTEWTHRPEWGFASLGITFWNWPELSSAFVADLGALLGHGAQIVHCRL